MSLPKKTLLCLLVLLLARPVVAQDRPPSTESATKIDSLGAWEPLGPMPVDQAGAGRRGYVLPGESAEVTAPGAGEFSLHTVAANNFFREQTNNFLITQRYETHTLALGYRRGFKVGNFPRFELGAQIQLNESDSGFMNGFILGFEDLWTSVTGQASAKNQLRTNVATLPPLGTVIIKDGRPLYQEPGDGSGFGDFSFVAKALLRDGDVSSGSPRVAARVALNVSGKSEFTEGNFAGFGLSVDKKLSRLVAFHGDVRTTLFLDRVSQWNLPLRRASVAFSAGPELKLTRNSSFSLQIDGGTTPYLPTGTRAFDKAYGDITFGVGHRFRAGRRSIVTQIYGRENMDLPFLVRWNTDPDFSIGIKATIH